MAGKLRRSFASFKDAFETVVEATCDCGGTHRPEKKPDSAIEILDCWHNPERLCLQLAAEDRTAKIVSRLAPTCWYRPHQVIIDSVYDTMLDVDDYTELRKSSV